MSNRICKCIVFLALLLPAMAATAQPRALRIAAAADLQPVLPPLLQNFQRLYGILVEPSYASSSTLATQILNGAPYDLFLAANFAFPQRVIDGGMAIEDRPVLYALGSLVLWAPHALLPHSLSMETLSNPAVHRIAIANPSHAPYGAAAVAAIDKLGLSAALTPKLVIAENIAQAAQFVESGNADCALISRTIAITPTMEKAGRFVAVPKNAYPSIRQGAVILRHAANMQAAKKFLLYLQSTSGRKILASSGLQPPTTR